MVVRLPSFSAAATSSASGSVEADDPAEPIAPEAGGFEPDVAPDRDGPASLPQAEARIASIETIATTTNGAATRRVLLAVVNVR
jgi:hypothetical protein